MYYFRLPDRAHQSTVVYNTRFGKVVFSVGAGILPARPGM